MLPDVFSMIHWGYHGKVVLEYGLEEDSTLMSVHLICYSNDWLCACQHLRERGKHDNAKHKEKKAQIYPYAAFSHIFLLHSSVLCATWAFESHDISPGSDEITVEG